MQHKFVGKMKLQGPEKQPNFLFKRIQLKHLKIKGLNLYHWGAVQDLNPWKAMTLLASPEAVWPPEFKTLNNPIT